jgi:signal transduction histidine kinase
MLLEPDDKKSQPERQETDESLATERSNTDRALEDMGASSQAADRLVDLARGKADAMLVEERDKADQASEQSRVNEQVAVEESRTRADEVLQGERALADTRLRREREEHARTLSALLPLERENTDRDLLTERARSDEAIANRDDFLGIVSHDLLNLLGGIVLAASSLSKTASKTDEGVRIVVTGKRIQLYAARMKRLIGDLVDIASIDAGKLGITIVPSDPLTLIADTLETFRCVAEEKGIVLESQVKGALPRAAFDYERMLQVLANLVANAIKFTPRGGHVCIRCERSEDEAHFSVSDTGAGIRQNMFEAVFVRFWQASQNDRRGTGLGLYISKSIVDAHKGRIWVESTVGQGSVFHFTLPLAPSAVA